MYSVLAVFFVLFLAGIVTGNYYLVAPLIALGVNFTNLGFAWGGIAFNFGSQNISSYTKLVFHINKSEMTSLTQLGIKFEDNPGGFVEVNLSAYTPTLAGNWLRYEIPFSHFPGVNFSQMEFLGFWSPRNSSGNLLFGNLYFDLLS